MLSVVKSESIKRPFYDGESYTTEDTENAEIKIFPHKDREPQIMTLDYNWNKIAGELIEGSRGMLWRTHSDRINSELLDRWLPVGRRQRVLKTDLFDEAVSDGLYPAMNRKSKYIFGMDLSMRILLDVTTSHPDIMSLCADVRRLPFADGVFDYVVSNSTLDHFTRDDEIVSALQEVYRILRPGGRVILTLDNPVNPVLALRRLLPFGFLRQLGLLPYYVGRTYSPWQLRRVLERLGMEVMELGTVMHFPRVLVVMLGRVMAKIMGSRMNGQFLKLIMAFEGMAGLPTGYLTGYFVAVSAQKKDRQPS